MSKNMKTAILFPPLSFLKTAPFAMLFSGFMQKKMLLTYPLSLYTRKDTGEINWLGFIYSFLFTGKDREKICSITYPLCFDKTRTEEIFERLLKEVEELALSFGASRIEYEGYQNVTGEIFSPVSVIGFGNTPNPAFLTFIKEKGFIQNHVNPCYEVTWSPQYENQWSTKDIRVYTIPDFHQRRTQYYTMCSLSDSFVQYIDVEHIKTTFSPAGDRFFKEDWIIFTEAGEEKGCFRWIPHTVVAHKKDSKREAKIIRLLFHKATPQFMVTSTAAVLTRIHKTGGTRIQTVNSGQHPIESMLKDVNASKVYETVTMIKYC